MPQPFYIDSSNQPKLKDCKIISVFDLLADARSQVTSVNSYIESLRDFWLSQSDLEMSLIGKPNFTELGTAQMAGQGETP